MLQQLGPTFVKIGQMASSRADALPEDWREELDKLQSTVPPFPWEQARGDHHRASWAREPEDALRDHRRRAVRRRVSLAQVHRATLKDGTAGGGQGPAPGRPGQGARRPGRHHGAGGGRRGAHQPSARQMDATGPGQGVRGRRPGGARLHASRRTTPGGSRTWCGPSPGVTVPAIHGALSTSRVLVMDFVPGRQGDQGGPAGPVDRPRGRSRGRSCASMIKQVHGRRLLPRRPAPGQRDARHRTRACSRSWTWVSWASCEQEQRFDLIALLWALQMGDPGALASVVHAPVPSRPGPSTRARTGRPSSGSTTSTGSTATRPSAG